MSTVPKFLYPRTAGCVVTHKPHIWYLNGKWQSTPYPTRDLSPVVEYMVAARNSAAWLWTRGVEPTWQESPR